MFFKGCADRSAETLINCINEKAIVGNISITDYLRAYLDLEDHGYTPHRVNHSQNLADPDNLVSTNMIERSWNGVKYNIKPGN